MYRVRQAFVERGLKAALFRRKPTGRQYRKLDGAQEAQLIALACNAPPEGRASWTLRLLADRWVALEAHHLSVDSKTRLQRILVDFL